ncbi:MAG: polymerase subunit epsilon [Acidimicrobiaceae bacterium]|nr:polymerase subunit epsilon [Acidimicrobiaceae bacterium]
MHAGWHGGSLLGLDFETTGIDRRMDVPVSYALVPVVAGLPGEPQAALVDPGRSIPADATAIHGITTERARAEGQPLRDAVLEVAEAVLAAGRSGTPLVGMNLCFDLSILDHQLRALTGSGLAERGWRGPVLDVLVLDRHLDRYRKGKRRLEHLCAHYAVSIQRSHEAGADAMAAVGVLLALCERFPNLLEVELEELTEHQASWHREWATDYDAWRARSGLSRLDLDDFDWPLIGALAQVG